MEGILKQECGHRPSFAFGWESVTGNIVMGYGSLVCQWPLEFSCTEVQKRFPSMPWRGVSPLQGSEILVTVEIQNN